MFVRRTSPTVVGSADTSRESCSSGPQLDSLAVARTSGVLPFVGALAELPPVQEAPARIRQPADRDFKASEVTLARLAHAVGGSPPDRAQRHIPNGDSGADVAAVNLPSRVRATQCVQSAPTRGQQCRAVRPIDDPPTGLRQRTDAAVM